MEHTIGVVCSCVPACSIALRRISPHLIKLRVSLTSHSRRLIARFIIGVRSRARRLLGLGTAKFSRNSNDQDVQMASAGRGVLLLADLPEVPQRAYHMLTARAFIWGVQGADSISVDEERSGTSFSFIWLFKRFGRTTKGVALLKQRFNYCLKKSGFCGCKLTYHLFFLSFLLDICHFSSFATT